MGSRTLQKSDAEADKYERIRLANQSTGRPLPNKPTEAESSAPETTDADDEQDFTEE
jgi:hypothetical protein